MFRGRSVVFRHVIATAFSPSLGVYHFVMERAGRISLVPCHFARHMGGSVFCSCFVALDFDNVIVGVVCSIGEKGFSEGRKGLDEDGQLLC